MIEQLLEMFKEKGVSIQITADRDKNPTVHAFIWNEEEKGYKLHDTVHETVVGALELMKEKLFG
jgi:hypothetical protein